MSWCPTPQLNFAFRQWVSVPEPVSCSNKRAWESTVGERRECGVATFGPGARRRPTLIAPGTTARLFPQMAATLGSDRIHSWRALLATVPASWWQPSNPSPSVLRGRCLDSSHHGLCAPSLAALRPDPQPALADQLQATSSLLAPTACGLLWATVQSIITGDGLCPSVVRPEGRLTPSAPVPWPIESVLFRPLSAGSPCCFLGHSWALFRDV